MVTAAEMLSIAAFLEGRHAQAFPSFGSERMGAPVISYCRIDDKEIRLREPIGEPDAVIIQDPTLLLSQPVFAGVKKTGYLMLNSGKTVAELGLTDFVKDFPSERVALLDATGLALKHVGRPVPNAALLGMFAAVTGQIKLESVAAAVREKFPGAVGEANVKAAAEAYEKAKG